MSDQSLDEQLQELAIACRVLAMYGHEDKTLGHLSLRDPQGRGPLAQARTCRAGGDYGPR